MGYLLSLSLSFLLVIKSASLKNSVDLVITEDGHLIVPSVQYTAHRQDSVNIDQLADIIDRRACICFCF